MELRNRAEILFHEALALEPNARTTFLKEACSGEPELFEEVVSLISAHDRPWTFLDSPVNYSAGQVGDDFSQSLIGTSIGRYQVVRLIKRSGMGEVYLARDTHLPREVALKLLPLMFTGDESRLRRFILEAEAASSLNHPNIITIHEIGHIRDVHYIVTEFVDGQTLRERLAGGRLELKEAVEIAVGVANALVASHAAGIVHRDIKPENIMIRRDGYVKVLDFGLAKLTERPDVRVDGSTPSISSMDTDPGTFMGTVGYLSPEQAKSLEVDTRSDLFSLGIVVYEMICGQAPFKGDTARHVIGAILSTEAPRIRDSDPDAPASIQRIVDRALRKDKDERYQQAEDLLADLKAVKAELELKSSPGALPQSKWWRLGISAAAIIVLAFLASAIVKTFRPASAPQADDAFSRVGFTEIQSWKSERNEGPTDARFSHDGRFIVFTKRLNQRDSIWIAQALKGAAPRQLTTGPTNSLWPIWSPDDQQIAFVSAREGQTGIWSIPANGGPETLLSPIEGSTGRTRSWSKDGKTIYYELNGNLIGLDVATQTRTQLTQFASRNYRTDFSLAPAEDRICYTESENGQKDVWVASLHGKSPLKLTDDTAKDRSPFWHPDGKRIVFTSDRGGAFQICVASVDGAGTTQITRGIDHHAVSDISSDGTKLLDLDSRDEAAIYAVDVNTGRESEVSPGSGLKLWPEASPKGGMILFQTAKNTSTLVSSTIVVNQTLNEGPQIPIAANGFDASWSPDESKVAFLRQDSGRSDLFVVSASGSGERRLTTGGVSHNGFDLIPSMRYGRSVCWTENGDKIIYSSIKSGVSNLWAVSVDGSGDIQASANSDPTVVLSEPVCGVDNRIAFVAKSKHGMNSTWSLWVKHNDQTMFIFESKSVLRPIGWSGDGGELIAASADIGSGPSTVKVISCSTDGQCHSRGSLAATYFWTIDLAPDGRTVAFISSRNGLDNIWRKDTTAGGAQRVTSNNEPRVFFPGLTWSADGNSIYFGKQSSVGLINMIDNFE